MYCTKCGATIDTGERFCTVCGQPVNTVTPSSPVVAQPITPTTNLIAPAKQQQKICNECGQELAPNATICTLCSAPVASSIKATLPEPPVPTPTPPPQPQYAPQQPLPMQQQYQHQAPSQYSAQPPQSNVQLSSNKNKSKIIIGVVSAVVAIAIIGVVLFVLLGSGGGMNALVGTWEDPYSALITLNRDGTGSISVMGITESFNWGIEQGGNFWIENSEVKVTFKYEFRDGDLYINNEKHTRVR